MVSIFKKLFGGRGHKYPNYTSEKKNDLFPSSVHGTATFPSAEVLKSAAEKCLDCATVNPEDAAYCGNCGKKLPLKILCQCGKSNPESNGFCLACGEKLAKQ